MRRHASIEIRRLAAVATLGLAIAAAAGAASTQAAAKPTRIVSLDLCADQLLIELVERSVSEKFSIALEREVRIVGEA